MKKEIIIAIGIGFILGLIITFGIYTANRALKEQKNPQQELPSDGSPASPNPSPMLLLEITEPEDNLVVNKNKVTVSGKTEPKAAVALMVEDYDNLLIADEEGVFSDELPLISGANEIRVAVISKNGEKQEKVLTIVYSTAKIE
ncbi:MAG TPA: hypothetical protein VMW29_00975 [Candidatus Bathyarchaeia archaeon]|nr:hypothetical protein [Candidatus Bathyarchaeia archaeon]